MKVGITGQKGFIGSHLYNTLSRMPSEFEIIDFDRDYFENDDSLDGFVSQCNVIVHLAALNRHNDPDEILRKNVSLVENLISSLNRTKSNAHVLMSSSIQEESENPYGLSKKMGRKLFVKWAESTGNTFTGLVIPNVFGPFGHPYYNSVVATFSHQISHGEVPKIQVDGILKLVYVNELVDETINLIRNKTQNSSYIIKHTSTSKVSELLNLLQGFHTKYQVNGEIPVFKNDFELNLFNTFRCYIDIKDQFPVKYTKHSDERGTFVEIIRLGTGGQVSFSTTEPGVTRGNHYHTRKVERFSVIKGKALIQLRRIGTDKVMDFYLDGDEPAYVDMPIWYTHNIKNIGDDLLYTNFWINETYNSDDADTFFEEV